MNHNKTHSCSWYGTTICDYVYMYMVQPYTWYRLLYHTCIESFHHVIKIMNPLYCCTCNNGNLCNSRMFKLSDWDKGIYFYSISTVYSLQGEADFELRKKLRDGYLAAISREDLDKTVLYKYQVCSKHFISDNQSFNGVSLSHWEWWTYTSK